MTKQINDIENLKKALKQFYNDEGPERVGFVTLNKEIIEVTNTSDKPNEGFLVNPQDTINATKKGAWATWHTHPGQGANLSGEDYANFLRWPEFTHFIIGNDKIKGYYYNAEKKALLEVE